MFSLENVGLRSKTLCFPAAARLAAGYEESHWILISPRINKPFRRPGQFFLIPKILLEVETLYLVSHWKLIHSRGHFYCTNITSQPSSPRPLMLATTLQKQHFPKAADVINTSLKATFRQDCWWYQHIFENSVSPKPLTKSQRFFETTFRS